MPNIVITDWKPKNIISPIINSDIFHDFLEEEGIMMTKSKGRGNPVRFILPKHKI